MDYSTITKNFIIFFIIFTVIAGCNHKPKNESVESKQVKSIVRNEKIVKIVKAAYAHLRRGPGTEYELIGILKKGAAVFVIDRKSVKNKKGKYEKWFLVEVSGTKNKQGWLTGFLLEDPKE